MPYRFAAAVTNPQRTDITRDFAAATGWTATVPDPTNPTQTIPNPITRARWLDNKVDAYVRAVVREHRMAAARAAAEASALADMAALEE